MRFLLALTLFCLTLSVSSAQKCTGSSSIFNCDADTSDACAACTGDNCPGGYNVQGNINITAQVCGTSTLTSTSDPTKFFNKQMCCPAGTYKNETYSCVSSQSTSVLINGKYWTGSYYSCGTDSGKDFVDGIASWLRNVIITVAVIGVLLCVGCTFCIAWSCCGLRNAFISRGYWRPTGAALLVSPTTMVQVPSYQPPRANYPTQPQYGQPQYGQYGQPQQQYGQPSPQQYGGYARSG